MTTVIGINANNDMYVDASNNIAMFSGQTSNEDGQTAIEQAAKTSTLAQLGEMIYFTGQGIPSFQSVFVGIPNYPIYSAAVVAAIQNINGVNAIDSITISANNGVMSYQAQIDTIYGVQVING